MYCQNALIDTVVTHMPHLKDLGLRVPSRATYRGNRCGTHRIRTQHRDEGKLVDCVLKYKAPAHYQRLPQLHVGAELSVFVGIRNTECSELTYTYQYKG